MKRREALLLASGLAVGLLFAGIGGAALARSGVLSCEAQYVAFSAWTAENGAAPPSGAMPACSAWTALYPYEFGAVVLGAALLLNCLLALRWLPARPRPTP